MTVISRILIMLSVVLCSLVRGSTIRVPQDQPSIRAGIDAASEGDTVLVDTGRYVETIDFNGKNIVVGSLFLMTRDTSYITQTVIDADSSGSVVTFENGEDSTAVLSGFTLTDASGWGVYAVQSHPTLSNLSISGNWSGGLYCKKSNLRLTSVVISKNWSPLSGGGIFSDFSSVHLDGVDIRGNLSTTSGGGIYSNHSTLNFKDTRVTHNEAWEGGGGGIFLQDSRLEFTQGSIAGNNAFFGGGGIMADGSSLFLDKVTVSENRAETNGGGLYCTQSDVVFKNGSVTDNVADFGDGGGFFCIDAKLAVERSAVVFNDAADAGGGIAVLTTLEFAESMDGPGALLLNVTMTRNIASRGGAIFCSNSVQPVVVNGILWGNTPQEVAFSDSAWWPSAVTVTHSDLMGGRDSILATERDSVHWLEGNIDVDPLFVDAENRDFNLLETSPAIDAGTSLFIWRGDTLVNLPDTAYEGNAPDMGAFESPYSVGIAGKNTMPIGYTLRQNYPNPFNPTTTIEFSIPQSGLVTLTVYDLLGREVETVLNEDMDAGRHEVRWNAGHVPSGIYFVRMEAGDPSTGSGQVFTQTRKVMVLR